jgi:hypothetical protein
MCGDPRQFRRETLRSLVWALALYRAVSSAVSAGAAPIAPGDGGRDICGGMGVLLQRTAYLPGAQDTRLIPWEFTECSLITLGDCAVA